MVKVGLTKEFLNKNLELYKKCTNEECLKNWNCAGCLLNGVEKRADWHNAQTCSTCSGDKTLRIEMAFCWKCLPGNVTVEIDLKEVQNDKNS